MDFFGSLPQSQAFVFLLLALLLHETSRFIFGDGSRKFLGIHRPLTPYVHLHRSSEVSNCYADEPEKRTRGQNDGEPSRKAFRIPNPLASLKRLWAKDTALITTIYGGFYTNLSCLQASISALSTLLYALSELEVGLIYLLFGVGPCLGEYFSSTKLTFPSQLGHDDSRILTKLD